MDPPPRPRLSLKLSLPNLHNTDANSSQTPTQSQPATPSAQTPLRTPSLKLNLKPKSASTASTPVSASALAEDGSTPTGSSKKRKRNGSIAEREPKPGIQRSLTMLKLVTKTTPTTTKNVVPTPGIKLKTKGKIPRRPMGVGYDSELEDREVDPVILEGLVLRMLPGEDCDYIRDCIANGTVGVSILQKGADIRLRFLDVNGRRGILTVRGRQYAISVVDLPTITEGMKSWDRKNFIKSIDISQMCLVLGRCTTDEEARSYPLPADVDFKNYKYAHGLTPPMRNVRIRRYERTARARLDDIEAIERKVNQLLEADDKARQVTFEVLDHDPRQDDDFSDGFDSDDDAEGEEEDSYFPNQNGYTVDMTEAPTAEDISALEAMMEEGAEVDPSVVTAAAAAAAGSQQVAADPNVSAAPSPATGDTPTDFAMGDQMDDDAEDDASDDGAEDGTDASDQEAVDEKEETKAKIREAEERIAQQREHLRRNNSQIIRKKLAKKIQELENDVRMMKRHAGIKVDEVGGNEDDGD